MTITPALICDLVLIAMFAMVVLRYMHRGFLADVVSLTGSIVSVAGASFVSRTYAQPLFDDLLRPGLESSVMKSIAENGLDIADLARKYGSFLPDSFLDQLITGVTGALDKTAATAAQSVVDLVLEPIFVPLISMILFFVVFTLARFLVSMLSGLMIKANKVPLAGMMNKGLGAALGAAAGCVDLFLVYCAAWSIMMITGGVLPVLDAQLFENSLILHLLGNLNPFV